MKAKLLSLFLAALMLTACLGGCTTSAPAQTAPAADAAPATEAAPAAQEAPSAEPVTFIFANDSDIDDFNPFTSQQTSYIAIFVFNCYECLWHLNGNMEYEMDLATGYEQVDDLTYVIKLREGVKFHDGQDFSAEDVVWTIKAILDEANSAWRKTQYDGVDSIEATGDYEVTIKLKSPTPAFLDNLAYTPIMCKDVDVASLSTAINGTGAFKYVSWTPNDNISFEKFDGYWDAASVSIDKFIVKPIPDKTVALTNLETGSLQFINRITVDNASTLAGKAGVKVIPAGSTNVVDLYEIGRHNFEPFKNTDVMRALFLALDRELINDSIYGGLGKPCTSMYPSATKYYIPADSEGYDIEKAKEILAGTPYKDGFEFDLEVLAGNPEAEQAAIIWQADLAKLGVTMNVKVEELTVWLDAYLNRTYQMIWNQYGMVGSDPATFNSIIMEQLISYQTSDLTELNELIVTGKSTSDDAVRKDTYAKIQELVVQYRPVCPYQEVPILYAAVDTMEGFDANGMGHTFLKRITLG